MNPFLVEVFLFAFYKLYTVIAFCWTFLNEEKSNTHLFLCRGPWIGTTMVSSNLLVTFFYINERIEIVLKELINEEMTFTQGVRELIIVQQNPYSN